MKKQIPTADRQLTVVNNRLPYFFLLILPFVLFYWMIPFIGNFTLGTDYINYHIYHHLELMFSIKTGSFPLFAPECFYGQSAAAYTQAQIYHPITWLAALMPGYWCGYSLDWITLFRLLSLGCCQILLFRYLLKINAEPRPAFLISLITVYNHRTLALFWHGCALEAYTGMIVLCTAVGSYYLTPHRKRHALLVIFATYWLVTSGYPPMVYYGVAGGFLFIAVIPFFTALMLRGRPPVQPSRVFSFWSETILLMGMGFMLGAAYLMPLLFDLMPSNEGRVNQPYLWSAAFTDTFVGFINNFFNSLRSGSGMFGGSPLFLVAAIIPVAGLTKKHKIPGTVWFLALCMGLVFLYMQGDRLPFHYWVWKTIPLASCIRGPGRASMILPLIFMLLLTWLFARHPDKEGFQQVPVRRPLYGRVALIAFCLMAVYIALPDQWVKNPHYTSPANIMYIPRWVTTILPIIGLMILGILVARPIREKGDAFFDYTIIALTILQIMLTMRYGPYAISPRCPTPTYDEMLNDKKTAINFQNAFFLNGGIGSKTVIRQLRNYFMEPDLAKIYRKIIFTDTIEQTYAYLNGNRQADETVIENFPRPLRKSFDSGDKPEGTDHVKLVYSSYNRLVFTATATRPAFFVLGYPYSGHWHARLNNMPADLFRANGAAQAICLPAGTSRIEFRYRSNMAIWGMVISCLTFFMLVTVIGLKTFSGKRRRFVAIFFGLASGAGIFFLWYHSLYTGRNLQTRYEWRSRPPAFPPNLAFGKPTRMSDSPPGYPYRYNSRHAVDGDRTVASCFITAEGQNPWWTVDLKASYTIGTVVIYKSFADSRINRTPLTISISEDEKHWRSTSLDLPTDRNRLEITFEPPQTARFVKISADGRCALMLNEVEIYPPL